MERLSGRRGDRPEDGERGESIADRAAANPAADRAHTSLRDLMLAHFTLRDALLIRLKYIDGMTHRQIGTHLCITESRISQRHADILERLQTVFTRDRLLDLIGGRAA
jgi:RNA polymerase sigma factor (sigma-70 family)